MKINDWTCSISPVGCSPKRVFAGTCKHRPIKNVPSCPDCRCSQDVIGGIARRIVYETAQRRPMSAHNHAGGSRCLRTLRGRVSKASRIIQIVSPLPYQCFGSRDMAPFGPNMRRTTPPPLELLSDDSGANAPELNFGDARSQVGQRAKIDICFPYLQLRLLLALG